MDNENNNQNLAHEVNIGKITPVEITHEMEKSYLDYAMSVIVARALPDVRDGLKPVHRRILYVMDTLHLAPTAKYQKSAAVVGDTMGKHHPHGDTAIYDSLVRMAQDFSMRYPLVDGQGNFGSIDGDSPAAMRYTESRLTKIAMEMLVDLDKETVDFGPNYDGSRTEPLYLPSKIPNLLLMGSEGIAVGMATKIPPHNLGEVVDATLAMIKRTTVTKPEIPATVTNEEGQEVPPDEFYGALNAQLTNDIEVDELMEYIKGPDFPTAGMIYDINEIKSAYTTGKGRILMRGKAEIEEIGNGKSAIIVTELPYQVNKALLVAKIAELVRDRKVEGITDLRDESDRQGIRVVIELRRDVMPMKVLNNLYKNTQLQSMFPVNMVGLVDGTPQTLTLKVILSEYIKHRHHVVTRRSIFELKQARARIHILEGLMIAVNNIDAVIKLIRESESADVARGALMERFKLSEIQATAILDMQLRRLAALERHKLEEEYKAVKAIIDRLEDLLSNPQKILDVVHTELKEIRENYGDSRRTKVYKGKVGEISDEDLIANEPTIITVTKSGYVKRQSLNSFRMQARGGKGVIGMTTKEEDGIEHFVHANTHDNLLFFSNLGKCYQIKTYEIAESQRVSKGTAIVNLLNITSGETITSLLSYDDKALKGKGDDTYILMATEKGVVKKTALSEFANIRKSGLIAIKLDAKDNLAWTRMTNGKTDVILVSREGKAIRFTEKEVRPLGRSTQGVRGIKLAPTDEVVGMDAIEDLGQDLFIIMQNGLGKKTPAIKFPKQARGGQGVKVANVTPKTGKVVTAQIVPHGSEAVIITSAKGQVVKMPMSSVPRLDRATQGVILMRFSNDRDAVAAATCLPKEQTI